MASDSNGVYIGLGDAVTAGLGDILTIRDDNYLIKMKVPEMKPLLPKEETAVPKRGTAPVKPETEPSNRLPVF